MRRLRTGSGGGARGHGSAAAVRVLHVMPSLGAPLRRPGQALVGYVAGGRPRFHSTVVGPRCDAGDLPWLESAMPGS